MKSHKRYYLWLITIILLCGCLATSAQETLNQTPETCHLVLAGDVRRVIQGTVRTQDMVSVATERLPFALGGGTPNHMEEIGECILIAGQGYMKSNNPNHGYEVVSSSNLKTPFLMGIEGQAQPVEIIYMDGNQSIEEIYHDLTTRYDFFAVAGIGEFHELATTALKKAPIYGEKIIAPENRVNYFHPVKTTTQTGGIFFGIAQTASSARTNNDYNQRMFYINFANAQTTPALQSHTHVAIVDDLLIKRDMGKRRQIISAMAEAQVKDVRHLLTQSRLKRALIMVYKIEEISNY